MAKKIVDTWNDLKAESKAKKVKDSRHPKAQILEDAITKYWDTINSPNKPRPITDKGEFLLKDIQNGVPGNRNRTRVSKTILNDLATAAAREGTPLMSALETSLQESGLGQFERPTPDTYIPESAMKGENSMYVKGFPDNYDQYQLKRNLVPKENIQTLKSGLNISYPDSNVYYSNADKYSDYISNFKSDPALEEPFRKEMRFLKDHPGQKYNSREVGREDRLAHNRDVINASPDMFNYADSVYKTQLPKTNNKMTSSTQYRKGGDTKNKGDKKQYIVDLYDDEAYSLGGWLGDNDDALMGAGQGALSGVATGMTIGGPIGGAIGGVVGGISGLIGGINKDKEDNNIRLPEITMPRTVGRANMTPNVMSFAEGGQMGGSDTDLTEFEGPSHEQGGIQISPDATVEGGETSHAGVINSDRLRITPEIADHYGLPKGAINKTIAEYSKKVANKYKGREGDPFSVKSKEMELNNISKMSKDLREMIDAKNQQSQPKQFGVGGFIGDPSLPYGKKTKMIYDDPNAPSYLGQSILNIQNRMTERMNKRGIGNNLQYYYDTDGKLKSYNPTSKEPVVESKKSEIAINRPEPIKSNTKTVTAGTGKAKSSTVIPPVVPEVKHSLPPDEFMYNHVPNATFNNSLLNKPGKQSYKGSPVLEQGKDLNIAAGPTATHKGDPNDFKAAGSGANKFGKAMGIASLGMSALQAIRGLTAKPDVAHLPRMNADVVNPAFIDPSYQLDQVSDSFNTANEQMNQVSKTDYLRRRIQSATEESKSKSGVLGQINAANAQMLTQTREINAQNKLRADQMNGEMSLQEENINAANKGAVDTNRDYQLNNLASVAGEYGRDQRLEEANKTQNERFFKAINGMYRGQETNPTDLTWETTGPGMTSPNGVWKYDTRINDKGSVGPLNTQPITQPPFNLNDGYGDYNTIGNYRLPRIKLYSPYKNR